VCFWNGSKTQRTKTTPPEIRIRSSTGPLRWAQLHKHFLVSMRFSIRFIYSCNNSEMYHHPSSFCIHGNVMLHWLIISTIVCFLLYFILFLLYMLTVSYLCQFSFLSTAWFHTTLLISVYLSSWKFSPPQSKQAEGQNISSWLSRFQTPLQQMSSSDAWLWTVGLQVMNAWMPYQINSKVIVVTDCTVN